MFRFLVLASLIACSLGAARKLRRPSLDGRIVGGQDSDIADYPYQLSFEFVNSHRCGASIISENYLVTAAHCVDGTPASSVQFRAGSSLRGTGGTIHPAAELIGDPRYDYYTIDFDVAVGRVVLPFTFRVGVQPIPLTVSEPAAGDISVISGWGTLTSGGVVPVQLQSVRIPIVDRDICSIAYTAYGGITRNMICAAEREGGKDSCQGDSGGPLVVGGSLAGIVSWGLGCAQQGYPGVYANVATLKDFITENTGVS